MILSSGTTPHRRVHIPFSPPALLFARIALPVVFASPVTIRYKTRSRVGGQFPLIGIHALIFSSDPSVRLTFGQGIRVLALLLVGRYGTSYGAREWVFCVYLLSSPALLYAFPAIFASPVAIGDKMSPGVGEVPTYYHEYFLSFLSPALLSARSLSRLYLHLV